MKNDVVRNPRTGKGYKITKLKDGWWVALFHKGALQAHDGWLCAIRRHAKEDGRNFVRERY